MLYPILVVEDDAKIAQIVRVYLEGAGFRVVHASKAKEKTAKKQPSYIKLLGVAKR